MFLILMTKTTIKQHLRIREGLRLLLEPGVGERFLKRHSLHLDTVLTIQGCEYVIQVV